MDGWVGFWVLGCKAASCGAVPSVVAGRGAAPARLATMGGVPVVSGRGGMGAQAREAAAWWLLAAERSGVGLGD